MNDSTLEKIGAAIIYTFFAALLILVIMYGDMKG